MAELARIPPVTRFLVGSTAVVSISCLVSLISPRMVVLDWSRTLSRLEIWRPVTSFFYGGGGITLLFDTFCLYRMSSSLEANSLIGGSAAYAWTVLMVSCISLVANAISFKWPILFKALLGSLIYLWTRENPNSKVSVFGLISLPARIYPLALICLDAVQYKTPWAAVPSLIGVVAGHLWWFISIYLPTRAPAHLRRRNPLSMPAWFQSYFDQYTRPTARRPEVTTGITRVTRNTQRSQGSDAASAVRHRWGSGQRLGAE